MTKRELIKAMAHIPDDNVVVCMDGNGGWDNIEEVDVPKNAIIFGGGSPFSDE